MIFSVEENSYKEQERFQVSFCFCGLALEREESLHNYRDGIASTPAELIATDLSKLGEWRACHGKGIVGTMLLWSRSLAL